MTLRGDPLLVFKIPRTTANFSLCPHKMCSFSSSSSTSCSTKSVLGKTPDLFISKLSLPNFIMIWVIWGCDFSPAKSMCTLFLSSIQLHPGFFLKPICFIISLILFTSFHLRLEARRISIASVAFPCIAYPPIRAFQDTRLRTSSANPRLRENQCAALPCINAAMLPQAGSKQGIVTQFGSIPTLCISLKSSKASTSLPCCEQEAIMEVHETTFNSIPSSLHCLKTLKASSTRPFRESPATIALQVPTSF
nr:hypothetical protein PanWU01x14_216970 [Ipomoea batatas]